jgi:putative flippase GtrA
MIPNSRHTMTQKDAVSCGRIFRNILEYSGSRRWLRFGLAGLLNAGFGFSVFVLLVMVGVWPSVALAVTMVAAIAFNFQTSRRLVFRSNGDIVRFVAVYASVLVVNWVALAGLEWAGFSVLWSQALLTLPIAAISFLGQQRFVFGAA